MEIFIDATNLIIGRISTYAAKQALLGSTVKVFNCENAIITGSRESVLAHYKKLRERGTPENGPFFPSGADRIVRRTIRGMLSYKKPRGTAAFKRIMCYLGVPDEFKKRKLTTIKEANVSKLSSSKYVTLGNLTIQLRGK
jgi:large subunit ribosomal protein L13